MGRALSLVASGTLTVAVARAARGRTIILPRSLNHSTGKISTRLTGFNGATWGKASQNYAMLARKLSKTELNVIIKEAGVFVKPTRAELNDIIEEARMFVKSKRACDSTNAVETIDERACLVDDSDSDEECKLSFLFHSSA